MKSCSRRKSIGVRRTHFTSSISHNSEVPSYMYYNNAEEGKETGQVVGTGIVRQTEGLVS